MSKTNDELFDLAKKYVEEAERNAAANPTSEWIDIVIVEPNKKPYKKSIPNTLEAMQDIVGGWIEVVTLGSTKSGGRLSIILNEEGKLNDLPFNRRIVHFDILVGTFFITAYNMQGYNISLTDEECETFIRRFTPIEIYI